MYFKYQPKLDWGSGVSAHFIRFSCRSHSDIYKIFMFKANILYCAHADARKIESGAEWKTWSLSEGRDRRMPKAEILLGWTNRKVYNQLEEPCSCRVVFNRPEIITGKTSMTMGRWNCQVILATMEKSADKNEKVWSFGLMAYQLL